ncbi:MAG: hypothetical protein RLZZ21_283 [Planctomycetota bacterium]|jgi:hypothetical protein
MPIGSTAGHRPLRLLRSYRGRPSGSVIAVTPELADRLVAGGWAVHATGADLSAAPDRHERAVATPNVETRGGVG